MWWGGGYLHDECEDKNFSVPEKEMYLDFHSSPIVSVDQTSRVLPNVLLVVTRRHYNKGGGAWVTLSSFFCGPEKVCSVVWEVVPSQASGVLHMYIHA